jgi:hypothetical protein
LYNIFVTQAVGADNGPKLDDGASEVLGMTTILNMVSGLGPMPIAVPAVIANGHIKENRMLYYSRIGGINFSKGIPFRLMWAFNAIIV